MAIKKSTYVAGASTIVTAGVATSTASSVIGGSAAVIMSTTAGTTAVVGFLAYGLVKIFED